MTAVLVSGYGVSGIERIAFHRTDGCFQALADGDTTETWTDAMRVRVSPGSPYV